MNLEAANRVMERLRQHEREETAFHEAGHAVAAYAHGIAYDRVAIVRDRSRGLKGYCEGPRWVSSGEPVEVCDHVTAINLLLAGAVSVIVRFGPRDDVVGAHNDVEKCLALALECEGGAEQAQARIRRAWAACGEVIRARWTAVSAVAGELLSSEELDAAQTLRIIAGAA